MSRSRRFPLAVLTLAATLAALFLGAPAAASAAVTPTYRSGSSASPNAGSPSGCEQKDDWPHASEHEPGTMDGAVTTKCTRPVPHIAYSAQMWETRWWGWDRIGHKDSVDAHNLKSTKAVAWDVCKNTTIRVTGSGYVVDVDGRTYYASTESIHVKNPCHL